MAQKVKTILFAEGFRNGLVLTEGRCLGSAFALYAAIWPSCFYTINFTKKVVRAKLVPCNKILCCNLINKCFFLFKVQMVEESPVLSYLLKETQWKLMARRGLSFTIHCATRSGLEGEMNTTFYVGGEHLELTVVCERCEVAALPRRHST
ncbi:Hypothetical predicted protein [Podarcis lilfordi]|uniref:Uncharacterized protein n=1 Tax=Podarcis lilfordi TaxID=74358 RepID=A0AA35P5H9_9SAUR|nr:Hypothetical predicted protein [Podarcis lilfordi]